MEVISFSRQESKEVEKETDVALLKALLIESNASS